MTPCRLTIAASGSALAFALCTACGAPAAERGAEPLQLIAREGVTGGVVLHIGFRGPDFAIALAKKGRFLTQLVTRDTAAAAHTRAALQKAGLYGRASVLLLEGDSLPYADDLARIVLVEDALGIPADEIGRVAAPSCVLITRAEGTWAAEVAPLPEDMDEWTVTDHDPGRTRTSADRTVGPPSDLRWLASPKLIYGDRPFRRVMGMIAAGGRLFTVRPSPDLKSLHVVSRCAFSGVLLWSRELAQGIPSTTNESTNVYSYPLPGWGRVPIRTEVRMAATEEQVFCFGHGLAAGTGMPGFAFSGRPVYTSGRLLIVARRGKSERTIAAIDTRSGEEVWNRPGSACAGSGESVFAVADGTNGRSISCYTLQDGERRWENNIQGVLKGLVPATRGRKSNAPPPSHHLVRMANHLLVAQRTENQEVFLVLSPTDGSLIRAVRAPQLRKSSFMPANISRGIGIDGDVLWFWMPPSGVVETSGPDGAWAAAGIAETAKDIRRARCVLTAVALGTGTVVRRIASPGMGRCYDPVMTAGHAFVASCETVRLTDGARFYRPFYRNGCLFGYMPAYGLLYTPPTDDCACYRKIEEVLALETGELAQDGPGAVAEGALLEGPAYDDVKLAAQIRPLATRVNLVEPTPAFTLVWETRVTNRKRTLPKDTEWLLPRTGSALVSPPTISGDRILMTVPEEHRVVMAGLRMGKVMWDFTAGARISGKPVWCDKLCIFGSGDGWVYALRASDGLLAWRHRLAPRARRIVAFDQFESAWPVLGEAKLQDGLVYATAGRHNRIPRGGAWIAALEIGTGKAAWKRQIPIAQYAERAAPSSVQSVALTDKGRTVSCGRWKFDPNTGEELVSRTGLWVNRPKADPSARPSFLQMMRQQEATELVAATEEPEPDEFAGLMLNVTTDGRLQCYRHN